ncbi:MAG: hypothetical protein ABEJ66_00940, partial [Candidatus Nanohaloarchaea archaeon]
MRKLENQPESLLYRIGSNWYQKLEGESYRWSTGRNATIYIYNYRNRTVEKELWVVGRSFAHKRNITYYLNGEKLDTEQVPSTEYRILEGGKRERIENKFSF